MTDNGLLVTPLRSRDEQAAASLVSWLHGLIAARNIGYLSDLRRPRAETVARLLAGNYAVPDGVALGPNAIEVFEAVAYLFARFHAGESTLEKGSGSLGYALTRVGSDGHRGTDNPGCVRLVSQILVSREPSFRRVQHGIDLLRADSVKPPNWYQLAVDLLRWTSPDRTVQHRWAQDFYLPHTNSRRVH
ncbi:type I-E CRISPR-associated protein Cse2/CasB [Nocardia sp. NBC_01503]|uniref:type I-E CRISPR-associated protein Cse2/CasB n=1 Tax=Nocardia sp. NBC_01503 TaxID=2975997 RepID=UPI002E7B585B|nr:type I-E CRISPR-associated protein Cse2/CasB [Nocardia sp. NBC_01503]WTL32736.1 type I-E CRISPR-associated protein Cse2/CasB [Nocardia sp. NBC_01503]